MFFNKKRNSLTEKIYSGTPLLRSPMGPKNFAVLTEWPYLRGFFFYKKMYGGFCQAAKYSGRNNEVAVLPRWP